MDRRTFLTSTTASAAALALPAVQAQPPYAAQPASGGTRSADHGTPRMNHVFIIVDDLNLALGCLGHPAAYTPHLDRLAARGTRFTHAFCTYPLCGPSRTALLTGQRPESFPMPDNEVAWRDLRPDLRTLPQIFRAAGYHTAGFGKIFHHGVRQAELTAWRAANPDQRLAHTYADAPSWDEMDLVDKPDDDERRALGPSQVIDGPAHGGTSLHTIRVENSEALPDHRVATRAVEFLASHAQRRDGRAFFLGVGFHKPHVPLVAPEKWWAFYDSLDVENLAPPTWFQPARVPAGTFKQERFHRGMDEAQRRHCYRGYLACVSWMDEQVGTVLTAMESQGLADTTCVTFVADHGYHTGEQAQWDKMQLLDPALRVPLIVAGPGIAPGRVCAAVVESFNLFPTVLAYHGLDASQGSAGLPLQPWLENPARATARPAFAWVDAGPRRGWSLRTDRFRYGLTSLQGAPPQPYLFDHGQDTHESTNLLADGLPDAWAATVADLDAQLRAHFAASAQPVPSGAPGQG